MNSLLFLLQAGGAANPMQLPIMLLLMGVVFYFFLIRPQNKKQKEAQAFLEAIKVGDKVITTSGIHGKITAINDDNTVLVQVDGPTRLKMEKSSINAELTKAVNTTSTETK
ncbi:MAG: preprotein translocase subunit YajC [Saprospirales bacterium]|nr:preprotein translocase subunit YajC [Saprospirales bacterium]